MQTKTRVVIATAVLGAALLGGGIAYAKNQDEVKNWAMDKIYQTMPAEAQEQYAIQMVTGQNADVKYTIAQTLVDENIFTDEQKAYIGLQSTLQLAPDKRTAVLELILDKSEYDVQREVTFYGIPKLQSGDAIAAIGTSGQTIWSNFTIKVQEAYKELFP